MTEERLMVAEAVFAGLIGEEHLTQDEVDWMFERIVNIAVEQELTKAQERGCNVFYGFEDDLIH